jgi:hypothetical protein
MLISLDRLLGLPHTVLSQQDNLIVLQEHLHAQTNSFPSVKKSQKELVLPNLNLRKRYLLNILSSLTMVI